MIGNEKTRNKILHSFPELSLSNRKEIEKDIMMQFCFYKKTKKETQVYCTACEKEYVQTRFSRSFVNFKHGEHGMCPKCGKDVIYHSSGYGTSNKSEVHKRNIVVFNAKNNDLYIRAYIVRFLFRDCGVKKIPIYLYEEKYRYYYGKNGCQKWKIDYAGGCAMQKNMREPNFCGSSFFSDNSYIICAESNFKKTMFKYCMLDEARNAFWERKYDFHLFTYLNEYYRHPNIEYLLKGGFSDVLVSYIKKECTFKINFKSNDLKKMLGLNREEIKQLRGKDCSLISNYKKMKKHFPGISIEKRLELCLKYRFYVDEYCLIKDKTNLSMECIDNYIEKQKLREFELSDWNDYLNQCIELEYNLYDSEINRPKELRTAHLNLTKIIERKTDEEINKTIMERYKELLENKCIEDDNFIIIPPDSQAEIIYEGKVLCHCVGQYCKKHASGKCDILFLRKKEAPDVPFYTIEVRDNSIWQYRGYKNNLLSPVPEDVENFVKRFKEFLKERGKEKCRI